MAVLEGERIVRIVGAVPELTAAQLVVDLGVHRVFAHALDHALHPDDHDEGERENEDVEPRSDPHMGELHPLTRWMLPEDAYLLPPRCAGSRW